MSSPQPSDTRSELLLTNVLVDGCFPTLIATDASDDGRQQQVTPPLIQRQSFGQCFRSDGHGGEVLATPPIETIEAGNEYMSEVGRLCGTLPYEPPKWDETIEAFQDYTDRHYKLVQDQLSDIASQVYASREAWPFAYRVHPNAEEFLEGSKKHQYDQPMEPVHYTDRLACAVKSAQNLNLLSEVPSETIKIVFTTHVTEPLRLVKKDPDSSNNEGEDIRPLNGWGLKYPEASVECQFTDAFPEWIERNRTAQEAYRRSITEAIDVPADLGTSVELTVATTADAFVEYTKIYEQSLFIEAAYTAAARVSFKKNETYWVAAPSMGGVEELVEGHLVQAVWLDPSMFAVVTGQQPKGREFYSKRDSEYKASIKEGLAKMRREVRQGRSEVDDVVPSEAREWGTWTQLSDV